MAVRTYAPVGQTPVLSVKLTRDHLSAIGGITTDGRLFMQTQDHAYKGPDVVRFMQGLLRKIPGKLLIVWDGTSIHRKSAVKTFLAQGGAKRIHSVLSYFVSIELTFHHEPPDEDSPVASISSMHHG